MSISYRFFTNEIEIKLLKICQDRRKYFKLKRVYYDLE